MPKILGIKLKPAEERIWNQLIDYCEDAVNVPEKPKPTDWLFWAFACYGKKMKKQEVLQEEELSFELFKKVCNIE